MRIAARHADMYNGFWAPWEWAGRQRPTRRACSRRLGAAAKICERTAFVFCDLTAMPDRDAPSWSPTSKRTRGGTEQRSSVAGAWPDDHRKADGLRASSYAEAGRATWRSSTCGRRSDVEATGSFRRDSVPAWRSMSGHQQPTAPCLVDLLVREGWSSAATPRHASCGGRRRGRRRRHRRGRTSDLRRLTAPPGDRCPRRRGAPGVRQRPHARMHGARRVRGPPVHDLARRLRPPQGHAPTSHAISGPRPCCARRR